MRMVRSHRPQHRVVTVMKKSFVINAPRPGRSTVTMVTHVYDQATRRTRTVYLGSFSVGLDPDTLPTGSSIAPGARDHGISLSSAATMQFGPDDLAVIRKWLEEHGSHRREMALRRARQQTELDRQTQQRDALRRQLEAELRPRIERDVRESLERERRAAELGPLETAMAALESAATHVVQVAARLRSEGHEVTNTRRASLKAPLKANPLDILQAEANRIRLQAFAKFEAGCKEARVMGHRSRGSASK